MRLQLALRLFALTFPLLAATFASASTAAAGPVTFKEPLTTVLAEAPRDLFTGDFNSDGHQDVLFVTAPEGHWRVEAALGRGDGSFEDAVVVETESSAYETAAVGHFDGDDVPDVVVSRAGPPQLDVQFLGMVGGQLRARERQLTNLPAPVRHLAVGDLTDDAGDEIAVSDSVTGEVRVYAPPSTVPVGLDGAGFAVPGPLVFYEYPWAADGALDILASGTKNGQPGVLSYVSQGGAWFTPTGHPLLTAGGDFNGDGRADAAYTHVKDGFTGLVVPDGIGARVEPGATALTAGDFSGDGRDDIALLYPSSGRDQFISGMGTPQLANRSRDSAGAVTAATADFDGDGRADLVTGHADGTLKVHLSNTDEYAGPVLDGPPPYTSDSTPAVSIDPSGPGAEAYRCRVDDGAFEPCASPFEPATALPDGPHTIAVQKLKPGVSFWSQPSTAAFTVDTVAPAEPQLTLAPADLSNDARFEFEGEDEGTFECKVDDGDFEACASPFEPELGDGEHTVSVRQVDVAGNASPALERSFALDTVAPAPPALLAGPQASTTDRDARFEFAGEPGAAFECALDGGAFAACTSPVAFAGLALGEHVFAVRQRDLAGNVGPVHRTRFRVVEKPRDHAPQPQPQPQPQPRPDEPRPRKAKLVAAPTATVADGKIKAGCRLDHGALRSCTVTAYVRSSGKLLRVGSGRAGKRGVATVELTRKGRRLVHRLGGVSVRLRLRATASDGTVLEASRRMRLLPLRALVVPADGLFASGNAKPLARGRAYVRRIAQQLDGAKRVRCVGHTDSIGSPAENRRLGLARAKAVCGLLRAAGAKAKLMAASRGETQPRATNIDAGGRALNRRVELTVSYR